MHILSTTLLDRLRSTFLQDQPAPPDPYNPDYLGDGARMTTSLMAFAKDHPIIAGAIALVIVAFVLWAVGRLNNKER